VTKYRVERKSAIEHFMAETPGTQNTQKGGRHFFWESTAIREKGGESARGGRGIPTNRSVEQTRGEKETPTTEKQSDIGK